MAPVMALCRLARRSSGLAGISRSVAAASYTCKCTATRFGSTMANTAVTDEAELKRRVDAWRRPYTEVKTGGLTPDELEQFYEDGFVIKHNLFAPEELEGVRAAVNGLVDEMANKLYQAGKIKDLCADEGFFSRLTAIEKQFPHASVLLHKYGKLPVAVQQLWAHERLLDIAQQIVGPNIAGHPVWNLRTKTPQQEQATVPWHQDIAYLGEDCWSTLQLTAWIPLLDATYENGCMQVIRGGHRSGKAAPHTCCVGGTWYVELEEPTMVNALGVNIPEDVVTCEVPFGSVLLLNNLIPHRSLNNTSDKIRWSFDLRWQDPALPHGFENIKDVIVMRKEGQPDYRPQWETWADVVGCHACPSHLCNCTVTGRRRAILAMLRVRLALQGDFSRRFIHFAQERTAAQAATASAKAQRVIDEVKQEENLDEEFDTTIVGPWMNRWPLINHNRHTAVLGEHAFSKA